MTRPFEGIRIIDATHVLAGPFAAYQLALVASGRADGVVSLSSKYEWDIAAGTILIQESGGKVTDRNGTRLSFNRRRRVIDGLIAARRGAEDAILRVAARARDMV